MMEIKQCCVDFYQDDKIKLIFGDSMHPGGLELTKVLAEKLGISKGKKVLDLASGYGTTSIFLAKKFECNVIGIDLGGKNIDEATNRSNEENVSDLANFRLGDAENLELEDNSFDYLISECSFCLFPDKEKASKEMYRVLKRNGKIGISDVVVRGNLPEKMKDILYNFICIQDAKSEQEYENVLADAGFKNFHFEDRKQEVIKLLEIIRKKIFVLEAAKGLGKIDLNLDFNSMREILKEIKIIVEKNILSYTLLTAEK